MKEFEGLNITALKSCSRYNLKLQEHVLWTVIEVAHIVVSLGLRL